jgi:hypothetical protein
VRDKTDVLYQTDVRDKTDVLDQTDVRDKADVPDQTDVRDKTDVPDKTERLGPLGLPRPASQTSSQRPPPSPLLRNSVPVV